MSSQNNHGKHPALPASWDELAEKLSSPEGLETARLLQASGLFGSAPAAPAQAGQDPGLGEPGGARGAGDGRRLCLIGESVAAGFFYSPWLTPAKWLAGLLSRFGPWEVTDLSKIGTQFDTLVKVAAEAIRMRPDLLMVLAGNNWVGLSARTYQYADRDLDSFQEYAGAIREHGMGGLLRIEEERSRKRARHVVDRVAALAAEAGVPVLFVIPASNQVDFETRHPVLWLPGDGVARWHSLFREALAGLAGKDAQAAETAAREMIDLDGGSCPTSHRLLAKALLLAGRTCEASRALQADLDTSFWEHRFGRSASAPSPVCDEIREGCRRHGLACVDLASALVERSGTGLLDRGFFLDHCHLSSEGIHVAMAAVAEEILRRAGVDLPGDGRLAETPAPALPGALHGLSRFYAGLYTSHLSRPVAGGPSPFAQSLFEDAVGATPGIPELARDYMEAMTSPGRAFLTAACARNQASPYPLQALTWLPSDLGIETLEPLCRAFEARGIPFREDLDRMLLEHHSVDRCRRDLSMPRYREDDPGAAAGYIERQATPSHVRALFPDTGFYLVTGGEQGLRLDLTLRIPELSSARSGNVEVSVNGEPVGSFPVCGKWARHTLDVEPHRFRRGLNRVSLRWPLPGDVGDQAIRTAVSRLQQGLPADIFPVFGEVFSLHAGPSSGDPNHG